MESFERKLSDIVDLVDDIPEITHVELDQYTDEYLEVLQTAPPFANLQKYYTTLASIFLKNEDPHSAIWAYDKALSYSMVDGVRAAILQSKADALFAVQCYISADETSKEALTFVQFTYEHELESMIKNSCELYSTVRKRVYEN